MKTIIAGSRTITDIDVLIEALKTLPWKITEVVSGCARGADALGEAYALAHGLPLTRMPADWERFGRRAGYVRNEAMAQQAQALVALWDGYSVGTQHMIRIAEHRGLKVHVFIPGLKTQRKI
jgi:hypothetical protein